MTRFMKEPLVHFFALGALLFLVHELTASRATPESQTIVVTEGHIDAILAGFTRTWHRPPTAEELGWLIQEHIREEVSAREAAAMGLGDDDPIIRRRLRQKLEFVTEDLAAQAEPTEAELRAWFDANADDLRLEPRVSFSQVFLSPERRGDRVAQDAALLLDELNAAASADPAAVGDPTLLPPALEDASSIDVMQQFGAAFAGAISELPVGRWHGPVESAYGAHLVRVDARVPGRLPEFEQVREAVRIAVLDSRRLEARERFYATLMERYTVAIEWNDAVNLPSDAR